MEPVFMILGQSAAAAASLAIEAGIALQDVPYAKLRARLLAGGQKLVAHRPAAAVDPAKLQGIVVDDVSARFGGMWHVSTQAKTWIGDAYRHDGGAL